MNIGNAIKNNRLRMKLKQHQLAEKMGVSQSFICQIENNKKEVSIKLLILFSEISKKPLPLLFWDSITIDDIKNKEYFALMKPTIDKMINKL